MSKLAERIGIVVLSSGSLFGQVGTEAFQVPDGLEVTVWASSPQLFNPTNFDIDQEGRIWACEGVRYRRHADRKPEGDRVVVLQDTNGDGKADSSHTFVEEEALIAPLGIGVFDNKVFVSQPPHLIVYTDVNRNLVFDEGVDERVELLTGFNARNHDHSLHSVSGGPDGKLYFNVGNCGAIFEDGDGREFVIGGDYKGGGGEWFVDHVKRGGEKSADGHVWTAGATFRMDEDGRNLEVVGHGYRNSYEQTSTSYGDLFQNDNDDPPACRVSYILEYGCAGYFTRDGRRRYKSEKRKGQEHWRSHWRQDDPGTMDAGDVYGGGSPTGVAFYENGALGDHFKGTLLACEPGRNVIFGYQPEPKGGTFLLERSDFLTTNREREFAGSDFTKRRVKKQEEMEEHLLFRPSDVAVGVDGALYVADWYDARVGGHAALDEASSGTIYRIAPKGFKPVVPKVDFTTVEGALAALKSPAVNVRYSGFHALKGMGEEALSQVKKLIEDENQFLAARGIWLLPHLGEEGRELCKEIATKGGESQRRIAAYRALRRAGVDVLPLAKEIAQDESEGLRREVALSLRDRNIEETKGVFLELAKRVDVEDKNALEAVGLGAAGQEEALWKFLNREMVSADAMSWDQRFVRLTWRLWPRAAVNDLKARANAKALSAEERVFAVESLAFIDDSEAAGAMLDLAADSLVKKEALAWLQMRAEGDWQEFGVAQKMVERKLTNPKQAEIVEVIVPPTLKNPSYGVKEVLALEGDAEKGKTTALRCIVCHQLDGVGPSYGPNLKGWGKGQLVEVIVRSLVEPSADIAHGFDGTTIRLKNGKWVDGLVLGGENPVRVISTGGVEQKIPKNQIKVRRKMDRSLMLSAEQLGMTAQDVADVAAYLKVYE